MVTLKEFKTKLFQLQSLLRHTMLTAVQKKEILDKIDNLKLKVNNASDIIDYNLDSDLIEKRRKLLDSNEGLKDIFRTFWIASTFLSRTDGDYLSKEAYIKIFTGNYYYFYNFYYSYRFSS